MQIALLEMILRIVGAAAMGAVIGLERQSKGKVAGLRTTMLICTGAALFMIVSQLTPSPTGDPGRIAAQVVTGIGFIGAGAIFRLRLGVTGITTAATIFVVAAIGLAAGGGFWTVSLAGTVITLFTLALLGKAELYFDSRHQTYHYSFNTANAVKLMKELNSIAEDHKLELEDVDMSIKDENRYVISFNITATMQISQDVLEKVIAAGASLSGAASSGSFQERASDERN